MINEKLNDNGGFVTDETLAAVAAIVNIEISFGSREDARKHMKGLETLVEMKGGIERLKGSFEGVLQRFVGWNDLNYAELFGSQLRFAKDCDYVFLTRNALLSTSHDWGRLWTTRMGTIARGCDQAAARSTSPL